MVRAAYSRVRRLWAALVAMVLWWFGFEVFEVGGVVWSCGSFANE